MNDIDALTRRIRRYAPARKSLGDLSDEIPDKLNLARAKLVQAQEEFHAVGVTLHYKTDEQQHDELCGFPATVTDCVILCFDILEQCGLSPRMLLETKTNYLAKYAE